MSSITSKLPNPPNEGTFPVPAASVGGPHPTPSLLLNIKEQIAEKGMEITHLLTHKKISHLGEKHRGDLEPAAKSDDSKKAAKEKADNSKDSTPQKHDEIYWKEWAKKLKIQVGTEAADVIRPKVLEALTCQRLASSLLFSANERLLEAHSLADIEMLQFLIKAVNSDRIRGVCVTALIKCLYCPAPVKLSLQRAILSAYVERELKGLRECGMQEKYSGFDADTGEFVWFRRLQLLSIDAPEVMPEILLSCLRETYALVQNEEIMQSIKNQRVKNAIMILMDQTIEFIILMFLVYGENPDVVSACLDYSTPENRQHILKTIEKQKTFISSIAATKRGMDIVFNIIDPTIYKLLLEGRIEIATVTDMKEKMMLSFPQPYLQLPMAYEGRAKIRKNEEVEAYDEELLIVIDNNLSGYGQLSINSKLDPSQNSTLDPSQASRLIFIALVSFDTIQTQCSNCFPGGKLPEALFEKLNRVKNNQAQIEAKFRAVSKLVTEFKPQIKAVQKRTPTGFSSNILPAPAASADPTSQKDIKAASVIKFPIKTWPQIVQHSVLSFLNPTDFVRTANVHKTLGYLQDNRFYWKEWAQKLNMDTGTQATGVIRTKVLEALTCQRLMEILKLFPTHGRTSLLPEDFLTIITQIDKTSDFCNKYLQLKHFIQQHHKLAPAIIYSAARFSLGYRGFADIEVIQLLMKTCLISPPISFRHELITKPIICSYYGPAPAKLPLQRVYLTAYIEFTFKELRKNRVQDKYDWFYEKKQGCVWLNKLKELWMFAPEVAPEILLSGLRQTHALIQNEEIMQSIMIQMDSILMIMNQGIKQAILMFLLYGKNPDATSACLDYSTLENRQQILKTLEELNKSIPHIAAIKRGIDLFDILISNIARMVAEDTINITTAVDVVNKIREAYSFEDETRVDAYNKTEQLNFQASTLMLNIGLDSFEDIKDEWHKSTGKELPEATLKDLRSIEDYQKQITADLETARKLVAEFKPQAKEAVRKDAL